MTNDLNPTTVSAILTFLGLIAKMIYDAYNRKLDIAERRQSTAGLAKKIDENTEVSKNAFDTANHINAKIADVHSTSVVSNSEVLAKLAEIQKQIASAKTNGD